MGGNVVRANAKSPAGTEYELETGVIKTFTIQNKYRVSTDRVERITGVSPPTKLQTWTFVFVTQDGSVYPKDDGVVEPKTAKVANGYLVLRW